MDETTVFKDFVIRHAQVHTSEQFVFMVERTVPDDWQPGDSSPDLFSVRYDGPTGEWTWEPSKGKPAFAAATGPGLDGVTETIFASSGHPDRTGSFHKFVEAFRFGAGANGPDHEINLGQIVTTYDAVYLDGTLFVCGDQQTVLKRTGPAEYERIHFKKGGRKLRTHESWEAIDGYAANDIYVTGKDIGQGSLFHFNGADWTEMRMPKEIADFQGRALCCAPDGYVYVAALNGALIRGNAELGFETVVDPADSKIAEIYGPKAMTFFKGKLYVSTLGWLYTPVDGNWQPVKSEKGFQPLSFMGVSSNDDVMLQYGEFGVSIYDGEVWSQIYSPYTLDDLVRAEGLQKELDLLGEGIEIMRAIRGRSN